MDTTRCWNKMEALAHVVDGDAYLIHLHRSPAGFTASHLLPSELKSTLRGRWQLIKRRNTFFDRMSGFNYWNVEDITGHGPWSAYDTNILRENGTNPSHFYSWKAHVRLLYFWKDAYDKVEHTGRELFGDRFLSVSYEQFSRKPRRVLTDIQDRTGLSVDMSSLPHVQPSSSGFREDDTRWYEAAEIVGLPADHQFLFRSV